MAEADASLIEVFKQAIASPRRRSTAGSPWNSQWPAGFDKNMQLVRPGAWAAEAARIPGGLRFKGGAAAWTIKSDVTSDPFTDLTLTIAASF